MAFKVLLADDSAAIKKVVQLSLQDFGAEIKSVGSGKDVLDVCRAFKPDIAFVDVLLPHKTGYEVVSEIKKDSQLKATPVVMLWSAFLAFDENKFKASGAEEKLEKPFEVATLRSLVTKLVPKLSTSPIAQHLDFPKVDFEQPIGAVPPPKNNQIPTAPVSRPQTLPPQAALPPIPTAGAVMPSVPVAAPPQETQAEAKEEWSMASFEDIGSFTNHMKGLQDNAKPAEPLKIPKPESSQGLAPKVQPVSGIPVSPTAPHVEGEEWVRKDVNSKFKVSVPLENEDENSVAFQYSDSEIRDTSFLFKPPSQDQTSIHSSLQGADAKVVPAPTEKAPPTNPELTLTSTEVLPKLAAAAAAQTMSALSESDLLKLKQDTRDMVEKVVWKLVPEIASQIIREEIQRLLGDEK